MIKKSRYKKTWNFRFSSHIFLSLSTIFGQNDNATLSSNATNEHHPAVPGGGLINSSNAIATSIIDEESTNCYNLRPTTMVL